MTRTKMMKVITHALNACAGNPHTPEQMASKVVEAIDIALIMESSDGDPVPSPAPEPAQKRMDTGSGSSGMLPLGPSSVVLQPQGPEPPEPAASTGLIIEPTPAAAEPPATPPSTANHVVIRAANGVRWETKELVSALERNTPTSIEIDITVGSKKAALPIIRNIVAPHGTETVRIEYSPEGSPADNGIRHVFDEHEPEINITKVINALRTSSSKLWSPVNVTPVVGPAMTSPRIINP